MAREVLAADTLVAVGRGRWVVSLDVLTETGVVRQRLGDYPDERRATQAARIIGRNVRRYVPKSQAGDTE